MKLDFEEAKKAFLDVESMEEWEELKKKYPDMRFSDMDREMKQHMNKLLKRMATSEQLKNPQIHYEVKKIRKEV